MRQEKRRKDFQTLSLFIILGFLTAVFVLGLRVVLYAPSFEQNHAKVPQIQVPQAQEASKP